MPTKFIRNDNDGGRLFNFSADFKKNDISFETSTEKLAEYLAEFTCTEVVADGFDHPVTANGPHHALFVAYFSRIVAAEMLNRKKLKTFWIDEQINSLPKEAADFLKENNYRNYKKLVEIIALLHDTGRPSNGIDMWDKSSQTNVVVNVRTLLSTTKLSIDSIEKILLLVSDGMEHKETVDYGDKKKGFLFGAPVGAGDCFHSGYSFHNNFDFRYMRLHKQAPGIRKVLYKVSSEIGDFIRNISIMSTNHYSSVAKYLTDDGILKKNFCALIRKDLSIAIESNKFKHCAQYFPANESEMNAEETRNRKVPSISMLRPAFFNTNRNNPSTVSQNQSGHYCQLI
jgi:hypothetical protein